MSNITVIDTLTNEYKEQWLNEFMINNTSPIVYVKTAWTTNNMSKILEKVQFRTTHDELADKYYVGKTMMNAFENHQNIIISSLALKLLTSAHGELLRKYHYVLVSDSEFEVLSTIKANMTDIKMLSDIGYIQSDEHNILHWTHPDYHGVFSDLKKKIDTKHVMLFEDKWTLSVFDTSIFDYFDNFYIISYMFNSSIMATFLRANSIQYDVITDNNDLSEFKNKIIVYDGNLNGFSRHDKSSFFSESWFNSSSNSKYIKQTKNNVYNLVKNIFKARGGNFMWTTFVSQAKKISGKGYAYYDDKENLTFLSCNAMSDTNFSDKTNLAFIMNIYCNGIYKHYFNGISNGSVDISDNEYALSMLLRWMWRSAIQNGKEIHIYIPSKRVRDLLLNWLGYTEKDIADYDRKLPIKFTPRK